MGYSILDGVLVIFWGVADMLYYLVKNTFSQELANCSANVVILKVTTKKMMLNDVIKDKSWD